jgi:hypothetical protein
MSEPKRKGPHSAFSRLPHWVLDSGKFAGLSSKAQAVYIALLRHANYSHMKCYPSRLTIAKKSGVYFRSVSAATNELAKAGLIQKLTVNLTPLLRKTVYQIMEQAPRAVKHALPQAVKHSHRSRDIGIETQKAPPGRNKFGRNGVRFGRSGVRSTCADLSSLGCVHLNSSEAESLLRQSLSEASARPSSLIGLDLWPGIAGEVRAYHGRKSALGQACDYGSCVMIPAERIAALAGPRPLDCLSVSLSGELERDPIARLIGRQASGASGAVGAGNWPH